MLLQVFHQDRLRVLPHADVPSLFKRHLRYTRAQGAVGRIVYVYRLRHADTLDVCSFCDNWKIRQSPNFPSGGNRDGGES